MYITTWLLLLISHSTATRITTQISRRGAILSAAALASLSPPIATLAADPFSELLTRLNSPVVTQSSFAADKLTPLPSWLVGRWKATQTLTSFTTPLGVQYIGAPGRPISEAEASAADTRSQLGKPVTLELRFNALPGGGAVEDRAFNARSRLDAFAGRPVVRGSATCVDAGVDAPGLQCSLVEFKGPANQKQIITSMRVETASQPAVQQSADGSGVEAARASVGPLPFIRAETERSIFARRMVQGDSRNFPPITTDSEVLTALAPPARPGEPASGKLRLISYLQPLDPLYFAAGKKAVSISDYSLTLTPMVDEPAPAAASSASSEGGDEIKS
jgi:hypothetical protein